ncbi:hypothetical protein M1N88_02120 [Dehalococcoidia bacterium]|nr:hypothetical protein [Dehalococcoidia bacterium]
MNNAIVQLKDAIRLLAEVKTIQDTQKITGLAEAADVYAQQTIWAITVSRTFC